MLETTDKIRQHIGEGELEKAIDLLVQMVRPKGGDHYDQAILLRGSLKEFNRNNDLGLEVNPKEKSRITMAVLKLVSAIEETGAIKQPEQLAANSVSEAYQTGTGHAAPPPNNTAHNYLAQCFFANDAALYYVMKDQSIHVFNPVTQQWVWVGTKMPSQDPRFQWMIYFHLTNVYFGVDMNAAIWGQNWYGMFQAGYVRYF